MPRKGLNRFIPQGFFAERQRPDYIFVIAFFSLVLFGLLTLSSASAVVSFQKFSNAYYYVSHQILFGLLPGAVLFYITSSIPYTVWRRLAPLFLFGSLALLIAVFIPGVGYEYGGARRWIQTGLFLFQPSEIVKLACIIYFAAWLSNRGEKIVRDFSYGFLPFITLIGSIALLIVLQPDMGTMGIIVLIAGTMYVVGGARPRHVFLALSGAAAAFFILIQTASYRVSRFMTFLHPELDPLGIGYHINQALLAVGSGGMFGRGFGHSRQKFAYLPEVTGDSIFAIIAEELGFLFVVLLIALFVFLAFRGLRIASRAPDQFAKLLAVGVVSWITFQTFVNIAAMLSLVPLTGIPLPLISYGGSALVVLMAAVGMVVNISRHIKGV